LGQPGSTRVAEKVAELDRWRSMARELLTATLGRDLVPLSVDHERVCTAVLCRIEALAEVASGTPFPPAPVTPVISVGERVAAASALMRAAGAMDPTHGLGAVTPETRRPSSQTSPDSAGAWDEQVRQALWLYARALRAFDGEPDGPTASAVRP
jgi:hypothetical protein